MTPQKLMHQRLQVVAVAAAAWEEGEDVEEAEAVWEEAVVEDEEGIDFFLHKVIEFHE